MAAVYKTMSKKNARRLAKEEEEEDEDVEMEDLLSDEDSTDSEEDEDEDAASAAKKQLASGFMPKSRVLMLTSRGASYR